MENQELEFFHEVLDKYSKGSHVKVRFLCPVCNNISNRMFKSCLRATHCRYCFSLPAKSRKKNSIPIPLEEALRTCTHGSQQLTIWRCIDCGIQQTKTLRQALRTKRCKKCSRRAQQRPDLSGKNNPMYGISHPGIKGESHYNWKGGKPKCLDCGKQLGDRRSEFCRSCTQRGDRNPYYNPTLTQQERILQRNTPEHREWAKAIKVRDSFKCQVCFRNMKLQAHHLSSYSTAPDLRYSLQNGVTLCKDCHIEFHLLYKKRHNTTEQFEEFRKRAQFSALG